MNLRWLHPWRSVRGRLLLAAVLVEATMLALLVANSLRLLSDHMTDQARMHAEQVTPVLNAALVAPLAQRDYATVQAILDESRAVRGIRYLAVVDRNGRRVATSGWEQNSPLPEPDKIFQLFGHDEPRYDVATPITLAGQALGALHFGLDLSHIVAAHHQLLSQGVMIAAGELVLSTGLLAILGFFLTRHLTALKHVSEEVAAGNLTPSAVAEGEDDLGRLGAAFNAMSRAVSERIRDLTEARDAQSRLAAEVEHEHARLLSLLSAMDIGVLFVDDSARVIYENPMFRTVWRIPTDHVLHGQTMTAIPELAGPSFVHDAAWHHCLKQEADNLEITLGDGRILTQRSRPVQQQNGAVLGRVYLYEDVTEDRLTAQQLISARDAAEAGNRAKAAFLATMSHEIRTPMNGILGMTDLMLTTELNEEQREYLGWAKSSAESLLTILNDILDFSKIDAGRLELEQIAFKPTQLLDEIIGLHKRSLKDKDLFIAWRSSEPLPAEIHGDATRLRQILNNLLSNAVKFTAQGQVILDAGSRIVGNTDLVWLELAVSDTGVGIPPEKLAHIFSPFAQADNSITRRFGGTGLGLAIAARLAELMGGEISVDSQVGKGSTFQLRVPFRRVASPDTAISL